MLKKIYNAAVGTFSLARYRNGSIRRCLNIGCHSVDRLQSQSTNNVMNLFRSSMKKKKKTKFYKVLEFVNRSVREALADSRNWGTFVVGHRVCCVNALLNYMELSLRL